MAVACISPQTSAAYPDGAYVTGEAVHLLLTGSLSPLMVASACKAELNNLCSNNRLAGQVGHCVECCVSPADPQAAGPQVAGHCGGCDAWRRHRLGVAGWVRLTTAQNS